MDVTRTEALILRGEYLATRSSFHSCASPLAAVHSEHLVSTPRTFIAQLAAGRL